jgi:hypothetical protein
MPADPMAAVAPKEQEAGSGQDSAAFPVPCRAGKLRVKIFRGCPHPKKARAIIELVTSLSKNRGLGRETQRSPKPLDRL